ncbi:MAG TPA: L-threonylcarbamoyladenylate synthase [Ktedonobacterales bacterium]|nr:L-threonylcarbamoyladenylate synthase [Ktedonobacterales bacterium]
MTDHTHPRQTIVLATPPDSIPPAAIAQAANLLRAGEVVAFPTETVYGLGADATSEAALQRIFAAKGRPLSDPLIVHLADASQLAGVARAIPPEAEQLAERFWPGPLTLVLPRLARIPALVAAGGDTVGVRVPSHPVAQALLQAVELPIAAPSANRFMHTSPTTAAHVLADLDGRIACILDGGPTTVGVESTVVDLTTSPPRLLRPGGVTLEALRAILPDLYVPDVPDVPDSAQNAPHRAPKSSEPATKPVHEPAHAPGQMARHYAPHTQLIVVDAAGADALAAMLTLAAEAQTRGERVGALAADEEAATLEGAGVRVARLGPMDDLASISRRLYAALRELDAAGLDLLLAHSFGRQGLGLAIEDRLRRAAGGRLHTV